MEAIGGMENQELIAFLPADLESLNTFIKNKDVTSKAQQQVESAGNDSTGRLGSAVSVIEI